MLEDQYAIAEIDRRLANVVQLGTVCEADYKKARVKVKIGQVVTGWLPWVTGRASHDITWWSPEIGEQVVILSPSGEMNQGVIIAGIYQQSYPAPEQTPDIQKTVYKDGTVVEYNRESHCMTVNVNPGGVLKLVVGGSSIEMNKDQIALKAKRIDIN